MQLSATICSHRTRTNVLNIARATNWLWINIEQKNVSNILKTFKQNWTFNFSGEGSLDGREGESERGAWKGREGTTIVNTSLQIVDDISCPKLAALCISINSHLTPYFREAHCRQYCYLRETWFHHRNWRHLPHEPRPDFRFGPKRGTNFWQFFIAAAILFCYQNWPWNGLRKALPEIVGCFYNDFDDDFIVFDQIFDKYKL